MNSSNTEKKGYYLGIDMGSTAIKAMLVESEGLTEVSKGSAAYPTKRENGFVTQSPVDWEEAAYSAVRSAISSADEEFSPDKILGISLSAQGGSIYAADANGVPLCDAVSWMDARADDEACALRSCFGENVYFASGWQTKASDCASKLLWLRNHDPELFAKAEHFVTTADHMAFKLCKNRVIDPTSAAITRLFDFQSNKYNSQLLSYLGVDESKLSLVCKSGERIGELCTEAAEKMGIVAGIPVFGGAHDQYCSAIGSGATEPGQMLLATGTAWVLFGVSKKAMFSPLHTAPGVFPDVLSQKELASTLNGDKPEAEMCYGVMATLSSIGASVERFAVAHGMSLADADKKAEKLLESHLKGDKCENGYFFFSPCEEGKGFLPHTPGYGFDIKIPKGKNADECYLALLEGAAFEAVSVAERFPEGGSGGMIMAGGATKSRLWSRIVAAVAASRGISLSLSSQSDAPVYGAALLAAAGCGIDIRRRLVSDSKPSEASNASFKPKFELKKQVPDKSDVAYYGILYNEWKQKVLNLNIL